jgi:hypothetical protein
MLFKRLRTFSFLIKTCMIGLNVLDLIKFVLYNIEN